MKEISRKDREKLSSDIPDYIKTFDDITRSILNSHNNNDFKTIASVGGENIHLTFRKMVDGILLKLGDNEFRYYSPYVADNETTRKEIVKDIEQIVNDYIHYEFLHGNATPIGLLQKALYETGKDVSINFAESFGAIMPSSISVYFFV